MKGSGGSEGPDAEVADASTSSSSGVATNIEVDERCETMEEVMECVGLLRQRKDMIASLLESCPEAGREFYVKKLSVINREMEVRKDEAKAIAAAVAAVAVPKRRKKGKK